MTYTITSITARIALVELDVSATPMPVVLARSYFINLDLLPPNTFKVGDKVEVIQAVVPVIFYGKETQTPGGGGPPGPPAAFPRPEPPDIRGPAR